MKVIITGHTSGLGKAIAEYFISKGSEVVGFSKSTGYDITNPLHRQQIIEASIDADVFVNNAYNNFDNSQLELLKGIFSLWGGSNKTIVNLSSRVAGVMNTGYGNTKSNLDKFCEANTFKLPKIINLKPGLVDTPRTTHIQGPRLTVKEFISILDFTLNTPLYVQSITFGK